MRRILIGVLAIVAVVVTSTSLQAQSPQVSDDDATRYMALGDSIAAGYKTVPVTNGYPYLLYSGDVFDRLPHTLFCNAAVPGATSQDVLLHQVPQALIPPSAGGFVPRYVTLTAGGNDLLAILHFASTHPDQGEVFAYGQAVLQQYGVNLAQILSRLTTGLPDVEIFVSNQYTVPEIEAVLPVTSQLIGAFNGVVTQVAGLFPRVHVVDVYSAFAERNSVLLVERHGSSPLETHPTALGHRVIAQAFKDAIDASR